MAAPEPLVFCEDDLTIGDLEDFEEITGKPLFEFVETLGNGSSMLKDAAALKMVKALVFIVKRRDNPEFTIEDAKKVRLSELIIGDKPPDPTPAAG